MGAGLLPVGPILDVFSKVASDEATTDPMSAQGSVEGAFQSFLPVDDAERLLDGSSGFVSDEATLLDDLDLEERQDAVTSDAAAEAVFETMSFNPATPVNIAVSGDEAIASLPLGGRVTVSAAHSADLPAAALPQWQGTPGGAKSDASYDPLDKTNSSILTGPVQDPVTPGADDGSAVDNTPSKQLETGSLAKGAVSESDPLTLTGNETKQSHIGRPADPSLPVGTKPDLAGAAVVQSEAKEALLAGGRNGEAAASGFSDAARAVKGPIDQSVIDTPILEGAPKRSEAASLLADSDSGNALQPRRWQAALPDLARARHEAGGTPSLTVDGLPNYPSLTEDNSGVDASTRATNSDVVARDPSGLIAEPVNRPANAPELAGASYGQSNDAVSKTGGFVSSHFSGDGSAQEEPASVVGAGIRVAERDPAGLGTTISDPVEYVDAASYAQPSGRSDQKQGDRINITVSAQPEHGARSGADAPDGNGIEFSENPADPLKPSLNATRHLPDAAFEGPEARPQAVVTPANQSAVPAAGQSIGTMAGQPVNALAAGATFAPLAVSPPTSGMFFDDPDFVFLSSADSTLGADMTGSQRTDSLSRSPGASLQAASVQVAAAIARNLQNGQTRFQVRLDPPELGRVDVSMKVGTDGAVQAHLIVERPETLDMFLRDQRSLERALEAAGLSTGSDGLQFSLKQDQGQQFGSFDRDRPDNGRTSNSNTEEDDIAGDQGLTSELYVSPASSGLDIRI